MKNSQARAAIAELQAFFPRFPIPEETQTVWALELEPYDFMTVRMAITKLAQTWPDDHYPSLQAVLGKIREVAQVTMSPPLELAESPETQDAVRESNERMHELISEFVARHDVDRIESEKRRQGAPARRSDYPKPPRSPVQGEPGWTPGEMDFCPCGGVFHPITPKSKRRGCGRCGKAEGKRRSWHDRTGKPYTRGVPEREGEVVS